MAPDRVSSSQTGCWVSDRDAEVALEEARGASQEVADRHGLMSRLRFSVTRASISRPLASVGDLDEERQRVAGLVIRM